MINNVWLFVTQIYKCNKVMNRNGHGNGTFKRIFATKIQKI